MKYITKNKKSEIQLTTMNERMDNGRKLYIAAWTFEIFAATIGILVAIVTGIQSHNTFEELNLLQNIGIDSSLSIHQWSDVVLGFVPFIMVAIAELLKIPMSYLVYINRNLITKTLFSIILLGLTFITFETIFNGFERQFNNITIQVRVPLEKLQSKAKQIDFRKAYIEENESISESDIEIKYYNTSTSDNRAIDKSLANIDDQILQVQLNSGGPLSDEIKQITSKRDRISKQMDKDIKSKQDNFSKTQKSIEKINQRVSDRIRRNDEKISSNDLVINESGGLFCFGSCNDAKKRNKKLNHENDKLKMQLDKRVFILDDEISIIKNKFQSEIDQLDNSIENLQRKLSSLNVNNIQIDNLKAKKIEIQNSRTEKIEERGLRKQKEINNLDKVKELVFTYSAEINSLNFEVEELREEVNKYNSLSQVYRLAAKYLNFVKEPYECKLHEGKLVKDDALFVLDQNVSKSKAGQCQKAGGIWKKTKEITPSEVTSEAVSKVALVWFGSLAFLVSIMGVVLAFGSLILKHPNKKFINREESRWSVSKTFRRVFTAILKKARKPKRTVEVPKVVIKEVPVDKVVFKEVPIEVVKKEVVHIPIYTNDPDLLKFGTTKIKDVLQGDKEK